MLKIYIVAEKFPKIPMCMFCCHSFFTYILLFYVCCLQCAECFQSCSDKIVCKKLSYLESKILTMLRPSLCARGLFFLPTEFPRITAIP